MVFDYSEHPVTGLEIQAGELSPGFGTTAGNITS
jgi:hypothetical protein